ncbi:MAG: NfeD family protein [Rhodoferax sp.]|nr:MAG: NfeD family protein [Rhodoferax sp.]
MYMAESTVWWVLAGAAVALELFVGAIYLLMFAVGLACAALAAHAGASVVVQILTAALVGGACAVVWHFKRPGQDREPPAQANPNVNMDIGETVMISAWNADGTADVHYRGAHWTAIHRAGVSPTPGAHRVAELVGNRLLVDKA